MDNYDLTLLKDCFTVVFKNIKILSSNVFFSDSCTKFNLEVSQSF